MLIDLSSLIVYFFVISNWHQNNVNSLSANEKQTLSNIQTSTSDKKNATEANFSTNTTAIIPFSFFISGRIKECAFSLQRYLFEIRNMKKNIFLSQSWREKIILLPTKLKEFYLLGDSCQSFSQKKEFINVLYTKSYLLWLILNLNV